MVPTPDGLRITKQPEKDRLCSSERIGNATGVGIRDMGQRVSREDGTVPPLSPHLLTLMVPHPPHARRYIIYFVLIDYRCAAGITSTLTNHLYNLSCKLAAKISDVCDYRLATLGLPDGPRFCLLNCVLQTKEIPRLRMNFNRNGDDLPCRGRTGFLEMTLLASQKRTKIQVNI